LRWLSFVYAAKAIAVLHVVHDYMSGSQSKQKQSTVSWRRLRLLDLDVASMSNSVERQYFEHVVLSMQQKPFPSRQVDNGFG
jgi:hypothetical protein